MTAVVPRQRQEAKSGCHQREEKIAWQSNLTFY